MTLTIVFKVAVPEEGSINVSPCLVHAQIGLEGRRVPDLVLLRGSPRLIGLRIVIFGCLRPLFEKQSS